MIYKEINLPDSLLKDTERYITSIIDTLSETKKINCLDEGALFMLAESYNNYLKCRDIVNVDGFTFTTDRGNIAIHPAVKIMKDCQVLCVNLMKEIGLTLKSRKTLDVMTQEAEDSPLVAFMKESNELL